MSDRICSECGSSGRAATNRTWAAKVHSGCPNAVKPGRRILVSTFVHVSPAAVRRSCTAAAATSGAPRPAQSSSAAALSDTVIVSAINSRSRSVAPRVSTARAIGTLIVDQATPLRIVPSSSTVRPGPTGESASPTAPGIVDSSASKLLLSAIVSNVRTRRDWQVSPSVASVWMTEYEHGYATTEQERLVEQAEHWQHRLIRDGTSLEPGTRLLEVGSGAGAVLAVLGQEFPGIRLTGVDIEPKQLEFARGHLERSGVKAELLEADAHHLPFADESFDHVWTMWLLEHIADPPAVLREARRVLVPDGRITAIEVDYSTCRAEPTTPAIDALFGAMVRGMAASGWSDAGTRLPDWLREAGFRELDEGERTYWWQGEDLARQANYAADVMESALDALAQLPGVEEEELRAGLEDVRALASQPGAGLGWTLHKSTAVR